MGKNLKKTLALFLAVIMFVSLVPVNVSADNSVASTGLGLIARQADADNLTYEFDGHLYRIYNYETTQDQEQFCNQLGGYVVSVNNSAESDFLDNLLSESPYDKSFVCEWDIDIPLNDITNYLGHSYLVVDKSLTWQTAKLFAEYLGGHLVTIKNEAENEYVVSRISERSRNRYWLGAYYDGSFRWVTEETWAFENWAENEPSDINSNPVEEDCAHIYANEYSSNKHTGEWNDSRGNGISDYSGADELAKFGFIVEWDYEIVPTINTYNGHTYCLINDSLTWDEANAFCSSIGGHLVSITDSNEQESISSLLLNAEKARYWIGLKYVDNSFNWVTDEEYNYSNWAPQEPNGYENGETCVHTFTTLINGHDIGEWNDNRGDGIGSSGVDSLDSFGFIVEWDYELQLSEVMQKTLSVSEKNYSIYHIFDIPMAWTVAKDFCEQIGGHLAVIGGASENDYIYSLVKDRECVEYWIGATDRYEENTFEWVEYRKLHSGEYVQEEFVYDNWDTSEPNNNTEYFIIGEAYVHMYTSKGTWNDQENGSDLTKHYLYEYGFICEWNYEEYTINWNYGEVNNNAVYQTVTQKYGTNIPDISNPEFEGYTFLGWDVEAPATMPAQNMTITALWAVNEYKVTYKIDGVEYFATPYESAVDTFTYGSEVTVRPNAVKEGYTVSDWTFTPTLENGKMPASDVVASATSSINSYTLTVNYEMSDEKNELVPETHTETLEYGKPYSIISPAVEGYTPDVAVVEGTMSAEDVNVTVTYTPNAHTVTWNVDGEKTVDELVYGDEITKPEDPEKEGYTFEGWSEDGENVVDVAETVPDRDIEYIAVWSVNSYTVTFRYGDVNDNAVYQTVTQDFGTAISEIADPEFTGYTFLGWDTEIPATMPAENITITALWAVNEYKVTYKLDGVEYFATPYESAVDTVVYGTEVAVRPNAVKEGHTVSDWVFTPALENGKMPASDVVANASSSINSYDVNITYEISDGKADAPEAYSQSVEYGKDYRVESPSVPGYTPDTAVVEGTMGAEDVNVTVTYTPNSHTVTWNVDGEKTVDELVYGDEITKPEDPEKEGYTFEGWSEDGENVVDVEETVPDRDIEYIAVFSINSYTITYNVDGVKYDEKIYEYNADVVKLAAPEKQGYVFSGWDKEEPEKMPSNNLVLNGSFSAASDTGYTVETYVMNLNGEYDKTSKNFTGTTGEIATAEYTVPEGFTLNEDKSVLEGIIAANGSLVLKVYLDRNRHNISFNDGTETASEELYYGDEITKPADPEKEGNEFLGWSEDGENVVDVEETVPDRDIEYIAVWSINSYTITFKYGEVNDNAVYQTVTQDFGTAISEIADPEFTGYTFSGWDKEIPATMPAENLTITALWAVNEYTVTYKLDGAEYFATPYKSAVDTVVYGSEVTVRPNAVKEGYTVSDWTFTPALENGKMPASDVTANATSAADIHTVTFTYGEVNGGAVYKEISAEYGTPVTAPENPEFSGFIFSGWDKNIPETIPAEDVTINAVWSQGTFNVTYKLDGEEYFAAPYESASDTVLYGEPVSVREKAVKEGYTVSEWVFTPALEDGKMPASDVTANAISTVNSYTVTWIVNGSSTVDTYNFGAEIIRPEDPAMYGKVFKGWSGEIPATMPARNLVFVASFDAITHTATFVVPDKNGSYTDETGTYEVVKIVVFEEGQTAIAEPAVPEKDGFTGAWEDYTIGTTDIVIKAIYTIITTDNTGDIETDKTAEELGGGVVNITLNAYSDAQSILIDGENEPLDIILVVDQSGSMAYKMGKDENANVGQRRRDYLVNTATSFVNSVKQNAEETGADHRVSIVGFAMDNTSAQGYSKYENTEVLTTKNDSPVVYNKATSDVYRDSLMSVTDDYSHIMAAINNIDARGATAANLGFDMASKVLSENASDRKKVVIFLTDGEPTVTSDFDNGVANSAIINAKYLKAQGVTVYSIAISNKANPADDTQDFNKFLHATSSNYSDASSIWRLGEGSKDNGYFVSVNDAEGLQKIFNNIYVRSVAKTLNFGAVTLYDTVRKEFIMTVPQEKAFRENAIEKYGITNSDITVDRRDDDTTYIEVRNLTPYPYYDSTNVMQGWKVDVSFDVSASESALNGGDYLTNTDEAGVIVGGYTVKTFVSPEATVENNRCIVEFIIGNDVYEIREMDMGEEIIAPECSYAHWNIPEGTKVSGRVAKYYANYGEADRTITWHIGDETVTQNYATGQKIVPPEVNEGDRQFVRWSPNVEAYMGYIDLEYTAVFSNHIHHYRQSKSVGLCDAGRTVTYTCSCGESYTEKTAACEHRLETTVYETDTATITHIFCTNCPFSEDKLLTFKTANTGSNGYWGYHNSTVASFDLYNDVDGGEIHNLDENQYIYIRVPKSSLSQSCRNALEQGKSINIIHYLADGGTEKCPYAVEEDYIVVKCTSFSYYVFTADELDESVSNAAFDCLFDGHQFKYVYNNDATSSKDGTETEVCEHCGATGETRTADGTKLNSEYKLPTSFKTQTAAYKTYVTVSVTLKDIPAGAKAYINGKEATASGNTYSADIGQVTATKEVKLEVKQGSTVLDSTTLKIEVNSSFFGKLISFFVNFLFNLFKWKKVMVSF